jgi:protein-tyrosine-phosphatase
MIDNIGKICAELTTQFDLINDERKEQLCLLTDYINGKISKGNTPKLIVICTHNSRRSHIGQIWLAVSREYYHLPEMQFYSGGTEATAFNIRAVDAFRRIGFNIWSEDGEINNPHYQVKWSDENEPIVAFSKAYDHDSNPKTEFAAIMVCTDADENCPMVIGCDFRISLPFEDPKMYDDTEVEKEKYDEKLREIGREMLYVMHNVITL